MTPVDVSQTEQLLLRTAMAANEAAGPEDALRVALREVCRSTGWPLGHAFLVDHGELLPSGVWHTSDPDRHAGFREQTERMRARVGVGLPGRVLQRREPVWLPDLQADEGFLRADAAAAAGLESALGCPMRSGEDIVGVLEFFATDGEEPSPERMGVLSAVGTLLGRVVERRRAADELARRAAALERSNRELEQFAYVASHDLQEPLRIVAGYVGLLKRRYGEQLGPEAEEFMNYAVSGAQRMQAMIEDLLAYSRIGRRGEEPAPTSLRDALDRALTNLTVTCEESGAVITCDELPTVVGDGSQLATVFQNLIGNAIKFRGQGAPRIHIGARREDRWWEISVTDDGIGIDPRYAERIFKIFTRLHTREEYEGNGIGLALCQGVIERHGGMIWVDSELGRGSSFRFTLPASP